MDIFRTQCKHSSLAAKWTYLGHNASKITFICGKLTDAGTGIHNTVEDPILFRCIKTALKTYVLKRKSENVFLGRGGIFSSSYFRGRVEVLLNSY